MPTPENRPTQMGFSSLEWQKRFCVLEETVTNLGIGPHASTHSDGGSDEISVEDLGTSSVDTSLVLRPDGLGGLAFGAIVVPTHAASHEDGGGDEINVADLSGLLADAQTPLAHSASHEDGGADEINVADLSGLLADAQTPLTHASTHEDGGSDEITIEDLATAESNTDLVLKPTGLGGVAWAIGGASTTHPLIPKVISADLTIADEEICLLHDAIILDGVEILIEDGGEVLFV